MSAVENKRKVKVFHRVNPQGTRDWVTEVRADSAIFHGFGTDHEEFETGAGNYAIAICELPDGSVIMPRADMVEFLPPAKRAAVIVYADGRRLFDGEWVYVDSDRVCVEQAANGMRISVVAGFDDGRLAQFETDGLPGVIVKDDIVFFKIPGIEHAKEIA